MRLGHERLESPRRLDSRDSLCSSPLASLAVAVSAHGSAVRTGRGALRLAAYVVRVRRAAGPFQSHPHRLGRWPQSGGTERGESLREDGRRKHRRPEAEERSERVVDRRETTVARTATGGSRERPSTGATRGFRGGSNVSGYAEHDRYCRARAISVKGIPNPCVATPAVTVVPLVSDDIACCDGVPDFLLSPAAVHVGQMRGAVCRREHSDHLAVDDRQMLDLPGNRPGRGVLG